MKILYNENSSFIFMRKAKVLLFCHNLYKICKIGVISCTNRVSKSFECTFAVIKLVMKGELWHVRSVWRGIYKQYIECHHDPATIKVKGEVIMG